MHLIVRRDGAHRNDRDLRAFFSGIITEQFAEIIYLFRTQILLKIIHPTHHFQKLQFLLFLRTTRNKHYKTNKCKCNNSFHLYQIIMAEDNYQICTTQILFPASCLLTSTAARSPINLTSKIQHPAIA